MTAKGPLAVIIPITRMRFHPSMSLMGEGHAISFEHREVAEGAGRP